MDKQLKSGQGTPPDMGPALPEPGDHYNFVITLNPLVGLGVTPDGLPAGKMVVLVDPEMYFLLRDKYIADMTKQQAQSDQAAKNLYRAITEPPTTGDTETDALPPIPNSDWDGRTWDDRTKGNLN